MLSSQVESLPRRTLAREVSLSAPGAMTGCMIEVRLSSSTEGLALVRSDTGVRTAVEPEACGLGESWSVIGRGYGEVRLIEHLLAALAAAGITDATIGVSGVEVPLVGGSAKVWAELVASAGVEALDGEVEPLAVRRPVVVMNQERRQTLAAFPYPRWRLVYILDWSHPLVGLQVARFEVGRDDFTAELGPARTFALAAEAQAAREHGLYAAGSEENLVVVYDDRLSAALFAPNAFARHKTTDLLGDLYLLGRPMAGLVVAYNSGHALNHRLVATLSAHAREEEK